MRDSSIKVRDLGAGPARALSIKVMGLGAGLAQGPVDKSEGLGGRAGPGPANRSVVDLVSGTGTGNKIDMATLQVDCKLGASLTAIILNPFPTTSLIWGLLHYLTH